ncbi:hypothetical protein CYYG_00026 [Cyanophage SS120-1]|uniref:Uncharacterized protein n=1 Tax=Cyanophage SS120-1 TaxID=616674 RepID=M1UGT0_9CAUD|nr:hypothetical protein CYYG_00026 [Cyanophage SS120-1]AGG54527.1 hypothetical protein CYYG_00026 [Cyanophage SS120-1]
MSIESNGDKSMTIKLNGSSSGSVSIDAPASTTGGADVTFNLPVADGTNGQAITTNASGQLGWGTIPTGTWTHATEHTSVGNNQAHTLELTVPSGCKYYQFIYRNFSHNNPGATSNLLLSLGTSSAYPTADASYSGAGHRSGASNDGHTAVASETATILLSYGADAHGDVRHGIVKLTPFGNNSNYWTVESIGYSPSNSTTLTHTFTIVDVLGDLGKFKFWNDGGQYWDSGAYAVHYIT